MISYSIINKSQLEGALRLDAEYYQPEYLEVEKQLNLIKTKTIGEISESVISFGAYSLTNYIEWQKAGVPYLNVENIRDGIIDFDDIKFISEKVDEILKKSRVKEGQVIITMAGTIGEAAVAHKIPKKVNSNQATAKITLKRGYSPYFLAAFLNCRYGKKQTEREIVSSVQPNIFIWQIKNFKVPIVSLEKQKEIENIYKQGLDEFENSKSLYSQAENLLLEELGLKDFKIEDDLSYIVNLSQIKSAHRADAEYFHPKYERIFDFIKCPVKKLGEITRFLNHAKQPPYIENGEIPIITQKHLGKAFLNLDVIKDSETKFTNDEWLKKNPSYKLRIGDVLYYSVGSYPYIGKTNIILDEIEATAASFIIIIRPTEEVNPAYLTVVLNSIVGQLQSEKWQSATVQQYIYPKDIKNFKIPILPKPTQQKIADLVQKSHEARKKAKELLEKAKQKVEELIEKG